MKNTIIAITMLVFILLSACTGATPGSYPPPGSVNTTPTANTAYPPATVVPTAIVATQIPIDLTPAQMAASQALAEKYNIPIEEISFVSTEAIIWPNGCLGVETPGILCTDALVEGYRIIMEANEVQYEFHTNQDGSKVVDATQQQSSIGFVVYTADGNIQIVEPNLPQTFVYNPAFDGLLPAGGDAGGTAYVYDYKEFKSVAVDRSGTRELTFIQNPTYGLAVWPGDDGSSPLLAWGTQILDEAHPSTLQISAADGSDLQTLLTLEAGATPAEAIVAQFWSADGQWLYFSQEPVGLGGYIPFGGASNLIKIDIASKLVEEVIPPAQGSHMVCLDAVSGDLRYVADHCTPGVITIRNLESGETATILPPPDLTGFQVLGSARFSPDGSQVAFALAKRDPENEQGWVAVASSSGGTARIVLAGDPGSFYSVPGWMDERTLLVQVTLNACGPTCPGELYLLGADGSSPTRVAEGGFLTLVDDR